MRFGIIWKIEEFDVTPFSDSLLHRIQFYFRVIIERDAKYCNVKYTHNQIDPS